ncbi:FliA/WhiG family RNA polymerase sigma factor [Vibrio rotiferianus]|uniref:RNA polymerase sigma factor for flagellar operon n=1 Tax=Vibrio rotiferianus TaxID=190895 RepID=A0A510ID61_9VIBR|nr:FliA/WhiG family RNA polymerase sigma factor [Vibrio rotiferianus]ASI93952.1 RNA polymerase subunit sigma [Vibrio rotiferianus]TMX63311.1 FliA/WhiG family RNA polymerase sigma factor [Vibrio rotiferianus]BBL91734.1 RNA polymerase sigma factor for flagellar operon [Vibrio rotiferianus]CAH1561288.1 RNA polymerase sigma factor for flagellar operon [Vibrio rotiferianus]
MLDMNFQDDYATAEQIQTPAHKIDENKLLQKHQIMVKRIVNQLRVHATTHCSIEDMQQIGLIALIEAGRRYGDIEDPNFPAFAVCRIRGSILDELRRLDWRSRKTRQEAHELNDVTRDLTKSLGRPPSDAEIIKALGTNEQDYYARQNAALAGEMQSLDQLLEANSHAQFGGDYDGMEHEHTRRSLESAVQKLNKRDQLLLTLFYQHELNLHEIALVLDLTPPRICQLHKQALKQLNHYLAS